MRDETTPPTAPIRSVRYKNESYGDAIEYLTAHPEAIEEAWSNTRDGRGGCLFAFASRNGEYQVGVGCLTMIRGSEKDDVNCESEFSKEITREIRKDRRLPVSVEDITIASLSVFREWQQRFDVLAAKEIGTEGSDNA